MPEHTKASLQIGLAQMLEEADKMSKELTAILAQFRSKCICPSERLADGEFSGGERIQCEGWATAEGVIGGCGEPCSFVMHNPFTDEPPSDQ